MKSPLFISLLLFFRVVTFSISVLNAETYGPNQLPDFVSPPVLNPIPDGIDLDIPEILGNQELARLGYVDVTAEPFGADPSGKKDVTKILQKAIDFARDHQMICFFPSGTYLVSDTLMLRHGVHMRSNRATFLNDENSPCVLVGSRAGAIRPKILLASGSPGFDRPSETKNVLEHQQYEAKKFTVEISRNGGGPSLMNTMILNLDIVIGEGNSGAVGMEIRSCEGSAVQDVNIDARHGHTGLAGATGNGGSWANVTVIGGRIGLDMRGWTPPAPIMVGITLVDQTEAAIITAARGPLTAVGIKIISSAAGPLIIGEKRYGAFDGGINLIDSEIIFRPGDHSCKRVAITSERSIYLNNVYVKGAEEIVTVDGQILCAGDRESWVRVKEFAIGRTGPARNYDLSAPVYVDGKKQAAPLVDTQMGAAPPGNLQSRHLWDADFPSWEQEKKVVNVKDPPFNAVGDSFADDTDALQKAIDESELVFLPKGYYRITRSLHLRPDSKLLGVAQHLSVIMAREPEQWYSEGKAARPLIETADSADADTVIAFLSIRRPLEVREDFPGKVLPLSTLSWRSGGRSIFRSNKVRSLRQFGFKRKKGYRIPDLDAPAVLISGNGGGKWYNYHVMQYFYPMTDRNRAILIDGISGPLNFYNFEPQGGSGAAVAEVRRSQNVSFFGCKTECDTTFLWFGDCDHIRVFGHGGIGDPQPGEALYRFERTPNYLISNLADQAQLKEAQPYYGSEGLHLNIRDFVPLETTTADGRKNQVPFNERPVLWRMGHPNPDSD